MSPRRISLYVVYDLIGTFGIGGGNHLGTVRTVEKEHVDCPLLLRSRALLITGLNLAPRREATTLLLFLSFLAIFAPAVAMRKHQDKGDINASTGLSQVLQRLC